MPRLRATPITCSSSRAATPRRRKSGWVRIDFSSPQPGASVFSATMPAIDPSIQALHTVTAGSRSPASSSAYEVPGGEFACMPARCSRSSARVAGALRSSSRMSSGTGSLTRADGSAAPGPPSEPSEPSVPSGPPGPIRANRGTVRPSISTLPKNIACGRTHQPVALYRGR